MSGEYKKKGYHCSEQGDQGRVKEKGNLASRSPGREFGEVKKKGVQKRGEGTIQCEGAEKGGTKRGFEVLVVETKAGEKGGGGGTRKTKWISKERGEREWTNGFAPGKDLQRGGGGYYRDRIEWGGPKQGGFGWGEKNKKVKGKGGPRSRREPGPKKGGEVKRGGEGG